MGHLDLNNRSLRFDMECDLAVEVHPDVPRDSNGRRRIARLRADPLAEHVATTTEAVEEATSRAGGSLIGAIEALRSNGRSLLPFEIPELNVVEEEVLAENELLDPEQPAQ